MLFDRTGPGWNYERLVVLNDRALGLRAIIAIDSTTGGPAFGGVRRRSYASESEALTDALALASAMTVKCALARLPAGGAKTVIMHRDGLELQAVYERVGEAVERLGGDYVCGPDLGTAQTELGWIRGRTQHVNPVENEAGASTARGVLAGLRAVWEHLDIEGRGSSVAVQGTGAVGAALIESLVEMGVRVVAADTSAEAVRRGKAAGARMVAPSRILETPCDVLVPCAGGGTITPAVVAGLRCRAICGSANNQLSDPSVAMQLLERGVVHAPDVVVSAGAVIEGVLTVSGGQGADARAAVASAIDGIESTTAELLAAAHELGQPPSLVAVQRAHRHLG